MTTALLAAFVLAPAAPSAADYFPLRPGTRLTYEEKESGVTVTVDVVGNPVDIAGSEAVPITTLLNDREVGSTFYRASGDTVEMIATNRAKPLAFPKPIPLFKLVAAGKTTWKWDGPASAEKMAEPLMIEGEAQVKPDRDVLGKKVPVIEVKVTSRQGGGKASEGVETISIYAKGIGLVESKVTTKINKRKAVVLLQLTKIEEPKESD